MQLEIGKLYTDEMLAEWFGIKRTSFKTAKKRKMAELEEYCTFEKVGKAIRVLAIKTSPEYVNPKKHNYAAVREDFNKVWDVSGLDTCINVGEIIFAERHRNDKFFTLTLQTTQNYARLVRNELFGKPFDEKGGKLGTCRYVWCKSTPQGLELFSDEDNIKVYIGDENEFDSNCTIIRKKYHVNGEEGTIAVIGPKRMDYQRIVGLLEYIDDAIDNRKDT